MNTRVNERNWLGGLSTLSVVWLAAYLPQWFTWNWIITGIGILSAVAGVLGSLAWLIAAAVFKNPKMLVAGVIVGALSGYAFFGNGEVMKARYTLAQKEAQYTKIVNEILPSPTKLEEGFYTDSVTIDRSGGDTRIAFDLGAGFIDDFKSIVYDEGGDIIEPRDPGFDPSAPFGGDYSNVSHLRGNWYFVNLRPDVPPGS